MNDQAEFPRNHNQVALPLDEQARIAIDEALAPAAARWKELEASYGRAPAEITSETTAENVTTLIAQIGALLKRTDGYHEAAKAPWLEATRTIDGVANRLREPAREAKRELERRLTAYQAEKQRKVEEERRRERESFEAAGDPEPAWVDPRLLEKQHVAVRSLEGATAHLQSDIDVEIVDVKKIPKRYLERPRVLAALIAELKPDLKKGDKVAGAKAVPKKQSRVRRG